MAQLISPQRKQEIIVSLELKIQENVEKISLYNDIYTYVDDMEPTHIPDSEVLPLKGDILREVPGSNPGQALQNPPDPPS